MTQVLLALLILSSPAHASHAFIPGKVNVVDVTAEYAGANTADPFYLGPTPTPVPSINPLHPFDVGVINTLPGSGTPTPTPIPVGTTTTTTTTTAGTPTPTPSTNPTAVPTPTQPTQTTTIPATGITIRGVNIDALITIGGKIWDFVVNNKPNADYKVLKASVVPAGITSWTQLTGWSRPVSKIYRVTFPNIFGGIGGSFDYRITFLTGGNFHGKGKYIAQISMVPQNIKLHTDRNLLVRGELSDPINFGTEDDPVAAAQLIVTWSSPTTPRFQMNSAEFFIYGTGEIQDVTNGN